MTLVVKDRVKEASTTAGTGTLTLNGASSGFDAFSVIGNGNTTYYCITDSGTGDWEVGVGTYSTTGPTLARTAVLSSSNSGNLVDFTGNSKDVFCTQPAGRAVYMDAQVDAGRVPLTQNAGQGPVWVVPENPFAYSMIFGA
jgi:hypothetical protein